MSTGVNLMKTMEIKIKGRRIQELTWKIPRLAAVQICFANGYGVEVLDSKLLCEVESDELFVRWMEPETGR